MRARLGAALACTPSWIGTALATTDKLTDALVRAARPQEKAQKLFDGGGLYLLLNPDGSRYWRLKYRWDKREQTLALGVYPRVSLKDARRRRARAKQLLSDGIDPSRHRKDEKLARRTAAGNTFKIIAEEWFRNRSRKWVVSNSVRIHRRLEKDVYPFIGETSVSELSQPEILAVLKRVEDRGAHETAHRIRQYIDDVLDYAVSTGRLKANPTPSAKTLQPAVKGKFAAITDPKLVGGLIAAIRAYHGSFVTRMALQLAPLVFVRPGELRAATWAELDLDSAEWRIPAERMKMRTAHLVPLSRQAVDILRDLHRVTGRGTYLFPSERTSTRCMSENTLNVALRTLGYSKRQMTAHGFRSMASTLLNEQGYNRDAIERQLAHGERDSIRAAYNSAEYLPERRKMMQEWADYLDLEATKHGTR